MFHPVGHYCMDYCCRVQVRSLSLHVDVIPHRNFPPVIRLRPAWQEGRRHPAHHPDQFLQHAARTDRRRAGHPEGGRRVPIARGGRSRRVAPSRDAPDTGPQGRTQPDPEPRCRPQDRDAEWTKKPGRSYFSYQNHIRIDRKQPADSSVSGGGGP